MELDDGSVAYLLGRGGQTKQRLANFTGANLEIDASSRGMKTAILYPKAPRNDVHSVVLNQKHR